LMRLQLEAEGFRVHRVASAEAALELGRAQVARERPAVITVDTKIVLRPHVMASIDHTASGILIRSRTGDLAVADSDVVPLTTLLRTGIATAGDLGLDLARRLLLSGLAIVE